jgi:outer membrane murein-binding lipoprotein Lpp
MPLEHEHRLTAVEERTKTNTRRLDEVEKRQDKLDELVSAVSVLANREQQVENDVKEIKSDVKTLTSKPAKRWESLTEKIIMTIAAAIVGFLLAHFGF